MGNSYPDRTNFNGVWKINELSKNKITHNNFPRGSTRGICLAGALDPGNTNVIDFITIETTGNATDFGDTVRSTAAHQEALTGLASTTRGVFGGGNPGINTMDYVTILSTGDSVDFGNLSAARASPQGNANDTRGLFAGGYSGGNLNVIDFITIATLGNATDFGDCSTSRYGGSYGCINSSVRSIFAAGTGNVIDTIEMFSTGNATDFGNLTVARKGVSGASSRTRICFMGNHSPVGDTIDYITTASAGNATDFGNLTVARGRGGSVSNGHGGLALTS